jgi:hypothetical protein
MLRISLLTFLAPFCLYAIFLVLCINPWIQKQSVTMLNHEEILAHPFLEFYTPTTSTRYGGTTYRTRKSSVLLRIKSLL